MDLRYKSGMTLVEVMVVVVIVGVLATLAVTQFSASREAALKKEAMANLKLIAAAEKIYRLELMTYVPGSDNADINGKLRLMLPTGTSSRWAYTVPNAAGSTFCAQAWKASPATTIRIRHDEDEPLDGNTCP